MGKDNLIISIGRECGSGGHEIGEKLAAHYDIPLYDRNILKVLAEKTGQNAADELYISWPQAIDKAIDRYMTVIDNFKAGRYPQKKNPVDDYFQFQGTLMDIISQSKLLEPYL